MIGGQISEGQMSGVTTYIHEYAHNVYTYVYTYVTLCTADSEKLRLVTHNCISRVPSIVLKIFYSMFFSEKSYHFATK